MVNIFLTKRVSNMKTVSEQVLELFKDNHFRMDSSPQLQTASISETGDINISDDIILLSEDIKEAKVNFDSVVEIKDQKGIKHELVFYAVTLQDIKRAPLDSNGLVIEASNKVICIDSVLGGDDCAELVVGATYTVADHVDDVDLASPMILLEGLEHKGPVFAERFIIAKPSGIENNFNPC